MSDARRWAAVLAVGVLLGLVALGPVRTGGGDQADLTDDVATPPVPTTLLQVQIDVPDVELHDALIAVVDQVLIDPRGWPAAGAAIEIVDESIYRLGVVEGDDMDRACRPFGAASKFGCQPGPARMINAGQWADPPGWWPGDVEGYRRYAVNHELGHMLGFRSHPPCPGPGQPLPVMALPPRDATECDAGEWPTASELEVLRQQWAAGPAISATGR